MRFFYLFLLLISSLTLSAQMKKPLPPTHSTNKQVDVQKLSKIKPPQYPAKINPNRMSIGIPVGNQAFLSAATNQPKVRAVGKDGLPTVIAGTSPTSSNSRSNKGAAFGYLNAVKQPIQVKEPEKEFIIQQEKADELGQRHIKLQQFYEGIKVYGGEVWLHTNESRDIHLFTGKNFPTPNLSSLQPAINQEIALQMAMEHVAQFTTVAEKAAQAHPFLREHTDKAELVIYHVEHDAEKEHLAWALNIHPNNASHWNYFIDAHSGEVLQHYATLCQLDHGLHDHKEAPSIPLAHTHLNNEAFFDGPETTQATDLNGATRTISTYEAGGTYFMIDVTKPMFNANRSNLPNDPVGAIWTLDARNTNPASRSRFQPFHITGTNNNWTSDLGALGVSAHYNAGLTYDYFLNTHNRNSINGQGGNIVSFINVSEENGESMENAFWDGQYIYYGNGGSTFRELARSLDVAGHEISHGVIQNTANLEYFGESGAMNESFADIFAVLIERRNWLIGEEVVNPSVFRGGALRNLQDPSNGGSRLGDAGWQPTTVSQQFRGRENNGGVHINSGIVNHAFYRFATDQTIGNVSENLTKAEQIYYRALTTYLTARSDFNDLRAAIILAARDLHGANSAEVTAAANAYAAVGITSPSVESLLNVSTTPQEEEPIEVEVNGGRDFVVYTDDASSHLYIADVNGNIIADPASSQAVKSRPSVTDDGTSIYYIGTDDRMYRVNIEWGGNTIQSINEEVISGDAIWRNVAVSRGDERVAITTDETANSSLDNLVYVFDFGLEEFETFELYNPTFTQGVTTGTVEFVDAIEFDFTGESIIYDAFNRIQSAFGNEDLTAWDIGFLKVWENDNNFWEQDINNNIQKLYSGLPEDDSVGNPTFSKNSPDIIAFDYVLNFNNADPSDDIFYLLGANLLNGVVDTIFANGVLNFPSFSRTDNEIIFNAVTTQNSNVIAVRELANNKISPAGNPDILINQTPGAQVGVWFSDGVRSLSTSTEDLNVTVSELTISPNPFNQQLSIEFSSEIAEIVHLEISNLLGQQIWQQPFKSLVGDNVFTIDLPEMTAGTYLLHLRTESGVVGRKVVKY